MFQSSFINLYFLLSKLFLKVSLDLRGGMLDNLITFQSCSLLFSILLHKPNFVGTMHIFDLFVWSANRMVNAGK